MGIDDRVGATGEFDDRGGGIATHTHGRARTKIRVGMTTHTRAYARAQTCEKYQDSAQPARIAEAGAPPDIAEVVVPPQMPPFIPDCQAMTLADLMEGPFDLDALADGRLESPLLLAAAARAAQALGLAPTTISDRSDIRSYVTRRSKLGSYHM